MRLGIRSKSPQWLYPNQRSRHRRPAEPDRGSARCDRQFPSEAQADLIIDLDDVEAEVQKPADQRNPLRLKKRLTAIATAVAMLTGGVTAANNLTDQVMELGQKVGIEMPQFPLQP